MTGIVEFDFAPTAQEESKGDLLQIDTSIFPKNARIYLEINLLFFLLASWERNRIRRCLSLEFLIEGKSYCKFAAPVSISVEVA